MRGALGQRVADTELCDGFLQPREEGVIDLLMHDHPLGRRADLPVIGEPAPCRPFDGEFKVRVIEYDERVAATKFHRVLLQRRTRFCRDRLARAFAARQGDATNTKILDQFGRLVVVEEDVGIDAHRCTCIVEQLFKGQRALRHVGRVLGDDHVARHKVRPRHAGKLVVGEVPWLDAVDHAQRLVDDLCMAFLDFQMRGGKEFCRTIGVEG